MDTHRILKPAIAIAFTALLLLSTPSQSLHKLLGESEEKTCMDEGTLGLTPRDLDQEDLDEDGLSDCLETELLGTDPALEDTDADGIDDAFDLLPLKNAAEAGQVGWTLTVEAIALREKSVDCDENPPGMLNYRYWDPYLGATSYVNLITTAGGGGIHPFSDIGYTEDSHPKDTRDHSPASIVSRLTGLSEDAADYSFESGIPTASLAFAIVDDDAVDDDGVNLGGTEGVLERQLPIFLAEDGERMVVSFEGSGECAGALQFKIHSPVRLQDLTKRIIDPDDGVAFITLEQMNEAEAGIEGSGHSTPDSWAGVGYASATVDPTTATGFGGGDVIATAGVDPCERAPVPVGPVTLGRTTGTFGHVTPGAAPFVLHADTVALRGSTAASIAGQAPYYTGSTVWKLNESAQTGQLDTSRFGFNPVPDPCNTDADVTIALSIDELDAAGTILRKHGSLLTVPHEILGQIGPGIGLRAFVVDMNDDIPGRVNAVASWDNFEQFVNLA